MTFSHELARWHKLESEHTILWHRALARQQPSLRHAKLGHWGIPKYDNLVRFTDTTSSTELLFHASRPGSEPYHPKAPEVAQSSLGLDLV